MERDGNRERERGRRGQEERGRRQVEEEKSVTVLHLSLGPASSFQSSRTPVDRAEFEGRCSSFFRAGNSRNDIIIEQPIVEAARRLFIRWIDQILFRFPLSFSLYFGSLWTQRRV